MGERTPRRRRSPDRQSGEETFLALWQVLGGRTLLCREYAFHPGRRWRFDFAHPAARVAVEIEGGIWIQGRHLRARGYEADCEKYSVAALDGWAVIRLTPGMLRRDGIAWLTTIRRAICERAEGQAA